MGNKNWRSHGKVYFIFINLSLWQRLNLYLTFPQGSLYNPYLKMSHVDKWTNNKISDLDSIVLCFHWFTILGKIQSIAIMIQQCIFLLVYLFFLEKYNNRFALILLWFLIWYIYICLNLFWIFIFAYPYKT